MSRGKFVIEQKLEQAHSGITPARYRIHSNSSVWVFLALELQQKVAVVQARGGQEKPG
jgi:hypothetical protein